MRKRKRTALIAAAAAAAAASTAVMAVAIATAPQSASSGQHAHRVACAATEDSYLTDCHGHRLDYPPRRVVRAMNMKAAVAGK